MVWRHRYRCTNFRSRVVRKKMIRRPKERGNTVVSLVKTKHDPSSDFWLITVTAGHTIQDAILLTRCKILNLCPLFFLSTKWYHFLSTSRVPIWLLTLSYLIFMSGLIKIPLGHCCDDEGLCWRFPMLSVSCELSTRLCCFIRVDD